MQVSLGSTEEQFLSEAPKLNADLIVLEYATIQPDQIRDIGTLLLRSGAGRAIVVYRVAARSTLDRIESSRIITIRGPIDRAQLHRYLRWDLD